MNFAGLDKKRSWLVFNLDGFMRSTGEDDPTSARDAQAQDGSGQDRDRGHRTVPRSREEIWTAPHISRIPGA